MNNLLQQRLLAILDEFVRVCQENNLKYYLAGGSALGAIRHNGFIPWDDDIDILMPRKDYERLQQIAPSIWREPYRLASFKNTPNYRYDFVKIEDSSTTLIERLHPVYIGGIFIDIFPYDGLATTEKKQSNLFKRIERLAGQYISLCIRNDNECHDFFDYLSLTIKRRFINSKRILNKWEKLASKFPVDTHFTDYHSHWMRKPMPIGILGDGVMHAFENKEYIIPSNSAEYLKRMYGDFMTLPPIEHRQGHSFLYLNLEKKESEQELRATIDRLIQSQSYHTSVKHEIHILLSAIKKSLAR